MSLDNFLSFSILFSCFVSAFFSILKFEYILDITISFVMLSFCLITILLFGISLIVRYTEARKMTHFNDEYTDALSDIRSHLDVLEEHSSAGIKNIHELGISEMLNAKKKK